MRLLSYCRKCVYPNLAVNLVVDDEGICSACRVAEEMERIPPEHWARRKEKFVQLLQEAREKSRGGYDCVIPVSGGKDSYWQAYVVKKILGFNPLLVTYHGNNFLPEGQGNLDRMREVLQVDHVKIGPAVETLKKLNRLGFRNMGDMNWHNHAGIMIAPTLLAMKLEIPLVVWGETAWDISGMFSPDDYVEWNKRLVLEHAMRGFTWKDMVGGDEGLTEKDLYWYKMPSDEEFQRWGGKGVYLGNFFAWDPNEHTRIVVEECGFEKARRPFDRTYRTMSNLDDMHENGLHDYLKYVKFGYGRASDHASKDIRTGYMDRATAIEMVRKYDAVKPSDLGRWLDYVGMTEAEFDRIADTFRDPRVWSRDEKGAWVKDTLWDFEARERAAGR